MPVFFTLALRMTCGAYRDKIGRRIIEFVSIHMVNMKDFARFWEYFMANLASVIVSLANVMRNTFPGWSIIPFGNPALPGRILASPHGLIQNKRLFRGARLDFKLNHELLDGCGDHAHFIGDRFDSAVFIDIFLAQPFRMFIWYIFSVMPNAVKIPLVLSLIPDHINTTSTFTERSNNINRWEILDWLTSLSMRMRFFITANRNLITFKSIPDSYLRNTHNSGNNLTSNPTSVRRGSCIKVDNSLFNLFFSSSHNYP